MEICPAYTKVCMDREIPTDILVKVANIIRDKSPEEQDAIRLEWPKKIEETYPYKLGKDPKSKMLYKNMWINGVINKDNWLDKIDELSDEEITSIFPFIHNANCVFWIREDRTKRTDITDRQRAKEIRDGVVKIYGDLELIEPTNDWYW